MEEQSEDNWSFLLKVMNWNEGLKVECKFMIAEIKWSAQTQGQAIALCGWRSNKIRIIWEGVWVISLKNKVLFSVAWCILCKEQERRQLAYNNIV